MIARGEVWWASLPVPRGSEPGFRHPILVVQADAFNRSRIRTVVTVALTSNVRLADAPGNVLLEAESTGLDTDSVAKVSQLVTLDRSFLRERVASLPASSFAKVEDGIALVLGLPSPH